MENRKTELYKGFTINIKYDECAENPREFYDHTGTIYSCCQYSPDGHKISELEDWETGKVDLSGHYWLPISAYEHGGITIWVGQPSGDWDSGSFGIIVIPKDHPDILALPEEEREEKAKQWMTAEVKELDDYYTDSVYGYTIDDENDEQLDDTCYGYYGDECIDEMIEECKGIIDDYIKEREANTIKSLKNMYPNRDEHDIEEFVRSSWDYTKDDNETTFRTEGHNNEHYVDTYDIPEWALCYLVNGERDNLTDEDVKIIDDWVKSLHFPPVLDIWWDCYNEINNCPAFGHRNPYSLTRYGESPYLGVKTIEVDIYNY